MCPTQSELEPVAGAQSLRGMSQKGGVQGELAISGVCCGRELNMDASSVAEGEKQPGLSSRKICMADFREGYQVGRECGRRGGQRGVGVHGLRQWEGELWYWLWASEEESVVA